MSLASTVLSQERAVGAIYTGRCSLVALSKTRSCATKGVLPKIILPQISKVAVPPVSNRRCDRGVKRAVERSEGEAQKGGQSCDQR